MPSGGARPGAGRKAKAEKFGRPIAHAEQRIADRLPELVDKAFELAQGVTVQQETDGGPVVYQRAPDRQAIEYLLNRIMGKPTEHQETQQSGELVIRVEYTDPEPAAPAPTYRAADGLT